MSYPYTGPLQIPCYAYTHGPFTWNSQRTFASDYLALGGASLFAGHCKRAICKHGFEAGWWRTETASNLEHVSAEQCRKIHASEYWAQLMSSSRKKLNFASARVTTLLPIWSGSEKMNRRNSLEECCIANTICITHVLLGTMFIDNKVIRRCSLTISF